MIKLQPLKVQDAVISGVQEMFKAFRINPIQAHEILGRISQAIPFSTQDIDNTECARRDVQLTVEYSPWHSINVRSQVTTEALLTTEVVKTVPKRAPIFGTKAYIEHIRLYGNKKPIYH